MSAIHVRVTTETRKELEREAALVQYRTLSDYVRDEVIAKRPKPARKAKTK